MSDIFVSYEKSDLPMAETLARALGENGWSIFYDRTIPIGSTWRKTIGKELDEARCVIVLWSAASIESDWVADEADHARGRGVLIPVLIQNVRPPIGFRSIQAGNLADWNGTKSATFQKLVADITKLIGAPPEAQRDEDRSPTLPQAPAPKLKADRQAEPAFKIFLCYRSDDSWPMAVRLNQDLSLERLNVNIVMMDQFLLTDDILTYIQQLKAEVSYCDVLLVLIDRKWAARQVSPDGVDAAISAALELNIPTIAILIDGATMPDHDVLAGRLNHKLRVQVRRKQFDSDVHELVGMLKRVLPDARSARSARLDGPKPRVQ
jgi:hypothetical protein